MQKDKMLTKLCSMFFNLKGSPENTTKKNLRKTLRVALVTISEDVFSEALRIEAHICLQTTDDSKNL